MKFMDYGSRVPSPARISYVETRFRRFRIRPETSDMVNTSPAFERIALSRKGVLLSRGK